MCRIFGNIRNPAKLKKLLTGDYSLSRVLCMPNSKATYMLQWNNTKYANRWMNAVVAERMDATLLKYLIFTRIWYQK